MTRRPVKSAPNAPIENAATIGDLLAPADAAARGADAKWGIDRLPTLVSRETAAKYRRCVVELDAAIHASDIGGISKWAPVIVRAYAAMDAEATAIGAAPPCLDAWPVEVCGAPALIVRDAAAQQIVQRDAGSAAVYTLAEVGRLMTAATEGIAPMIAEAKREFSGATITRIKARPGPVPNDPIPF